MINFNLAVNHLGFHNIKNIFVLIYFFEGKIIFFTSIIKDNIFNVGSLTFQSVPADKKIT